MQRSLIILLTSFFATLVSAMSGGGSSVISLPVFLSLGISFPLATAIQRVSALFWVPPAAWTYLKGRRIDWPFLILFTTIGLIGAYFGVQFIIAVPKSTLETIVGVVILFLVLYTLSQHNIGLKERTIHSPLRRALAYPFALVLGFYESLFGSGNGLLLAIITMQTRGFDFIDALGHYYVIAFVWDILAVTILLRQGFFDLSLMIPSIIGSVAGACVGSAYAKHKGNAFIKAVFCIIGTVLGIKLLFHF